MTLPVSYPPLNGIITADSYPSRDGSGLAYRTCQGCVRANITVSNAAVLYQLGIADGGTIIWTPERQLLPSFVSLERRFDAIRLRSAVAGVPAVVTVDALTPADLGARA